MNTQLLKRTAREYPEVSIIIPSYNQGTFIERTLLSILKQDYPKKEVIVIDGGSTDQTLEILEQYSKDVRWISEPDNGYADAVNKGLRLAHGSIVGIQSSDDYYNQHAFREAVSVLDHYPEAVFATGKRIGINQECEVVMPPSTYSAQWISLKDLISWHLFPAQDSTFIRIDIVNRLGGLNEEVDYCADIDLWMRALSLGDGIAVDRVWSFRQFHNKQRDSTSRHLFARDAKLSVELWLHSDAFPPSLMTIKRDIEMFGALREVYYYYANKQLERARESLRIAIRRYGGKLIRLGPCKEYCRNLHVSTHRLYGLMLKETALGLVRRLCKRDQSGTVAMRRAVDLFFENGKSDDPVWYLKADWG